MFRPVKISAKLLMSAPLWLALACDQNDIGFVPLDTLCAEYAEAVCDGRENCCGGGELTPDEAEMKREACEREARNACEGDVAGIVEESSLSYSGERAFRRLQEMRADLLECQPGYVLGRFFDGGLRQGQACERAVECASLVCESADDTSVCSASKPSALCEPTDK